MRITLDFALHPVLIVRSFVEHYQYFTLLKLQFVVVISITVVKSLTSTIARGLWKHQKFKTCVKLKQKDACNLRSCY